VASKENPIYRTVIYDGNTKYNITPAVTNIEFEDQEKQLAQSVTISIMDMKITSKGKWLTSILKVRQRVYIYANDGSKDGEVFRGYIWTRQYSRSNDGHELDLKCYDNLIYLQESEDSLYFSKGKKTNAVMSSIAKRWGLSISYSYSTITHGKLALRGTLSDIIVSDILEPVRKKTGKRYVIQSIQDKLYVKPIGSNTTVYEIKAGQNAISTKSEQNMEDMVTKVVILGKQDNNNKYPVKATVSKNTGTYGTLQKLQDIGDEKLAAAKKEAQATINENSSPKWIYEVTAVDIPWIRKGDKVKIKAGDIDKTLTVTSLERSIENKKKTMTLTLKNW
jgi:hypothetical protein